VRKMLKAKVYAKSRNYEVAIWTALLFLLGFVMADARISSAVSFVNVSLVGAVSPASAMGILVGSLLKYVVIGQVHRNIMLIAAMAFIVVAKLVMDNDLPARYIGVITFSATFAAGIIVSSIIGETAFKLVFYAIYSGFAGVTSGFMKFSVVNFRRSKVIDLKSSQSCAYAVVFVVVLSSLASFNVAGMNIGRTVGVAITLIAAHHYGAVGGILCGALTTCGAFLTSPDIGLPIVLLSVAGLLTGYLKKSNMAVISSFFVAINMIFLILTGFPAGMVSCLLEIILGTIIFVVLSPLFSDKWVITNRGEKGIGDIISSQMNFLADSISTVRTDTKKIADYLSKTSHKTTEIDKTCEEVCKHCYNRLFCWYNNYETTKRGFKKMSEMGDPSLDKIPAELDECLNKDKIALCFAKAYREKVTARLMKLHFAESQKLLFEQIKVTEEIIAAASERLEVRYSDSVSETVRHKLQRFGFETDNVIAYYTSQNKLLIELYFSSANTPEYCGRICELIADEVKCKLDFAEPVITGDKSRVRIFEKTLYSLESYSATVCASNSDETGDSVSFFSDGLGNSYTVLSDGMGSGRGAALESKMVVSMFKKLLVSGAEYSSAIKLINSIMLTKSSNEAFATLDAVRINLDTCRLTLIKSGASATLIRHGEDVLKVSSPTFPIGIVEEADTYARDFEFGDGDIVIMFSDGINENAYQYIKKLLLESSDIKYIVNKICDNAKTFCENDRNDDVTVIGLRVMRN